MTLEKHAVGMVFLRKAMKLAEKDLQSAPELLTQYKQTLNGEIMGLLDDLLQRDRL